MYNEKDIRKCEWCGREYEYNPILGFISILATKKGVSTSYMSVCSKRCEAEAISTGDWGKD